MCVQMSPQMACMRKGIVTLIAFVWFFSTVFFSNVSSKRLHKRIQSHIGCICSTFLHCAFSNVSSAHLHNRMHSHIGCICLTFLHCAFSNVSSNYLHEKRQSHIGCICLTFLHCVFSNVSSKRLPEKRHSHIGCICLTFLHCVFWIEMCPQNACIRGCKVILVAFVWFFSTVMCTRNCIMTLFV